ncbi:MAG: DUF3445 domain-containing protein [Phormidesmis sp.]
MHLPFVKAKGQPTLGLQALALADWIEVDQDFGAQLAYKAALLADQHEIVFSALPESLAAQKETLDLLVAHLLHYFPAMYQPFGGGKALGKDEGIYSRNLQQTWRFSDFATAPLDLAARLVQEDLCVMLPGEDGYRLAAASVCFPLRWCLTEKIGQPLGLIHGQVPGYERRLNRPVNSVFERLRADFSGVRFNWSVVDSPELHLSEPKSELKGEQKYATGSNTAKRCGAVYDSELCISAGGGDGKGASGKEGDRTAAKRRDSSVNARYAEVQKSVAFSAGAAGVSERSHLV